MRRRHVLFVGIDGLQYERLFALLPSCTDSGYNKFLIVPSFTGGITNTQNEQKTVSGPGWASLLTGVWVWKHEITDNDVNSTIPEGFPSVFDRINKDFETNPKSSFITKPNTFSIISWENINLNLNCKTVTKAEVLPDSQGVSRTLEILEQEDNPTFTFLHIGDIDEAGHSSCFGEEYDAEVLQSDVYLQLVLQAVVRRVQKQKKQFNKLIQESQHINATVQKKQIGEIEHIEEEWMVVIATDHGRDSFGWNHGKQTPNEKITFAGFWFYNTEHTDELLSSIKLNSQQIYRNNFPISPPIQILSLYSYLPQTSVAVTILSFFQINLQSEWLLDGESYFKPNTAATNPIIDYAFISENILYWGVNPITIDTDSTATITILIISNGDILLENTVLYSIGFWKLSSEPETDEVWDIKLSTTGLCNTFCWVRYRRQLSSLKNCLLQ